MVITFYATNNFTGDGTTVNWNINFADGYIDTTNVKARYLDSTGSYVDIAISSVAGNVVTISPAVANGQEFQIYRDTEKRFPLVDFSDGAILNETNLDTLATQAVMVSAEAFDQSNNGVRIAGDSLVVAQGIDAKAQLALDNSDAAVATANAIDGKAQTALDSSAAAVVTANAAASTASGAATTANTALTTANDAADDAATAITTANGAVTTANAATTTANAASAAAAAATTTANNAANSAANAVSTAGTALSTANTASTNASTAVTTANDAKATAEGIEAKADAALAASATAVSTANSAEATANAIDGKAQTALDAADSAVSTANSALSSANSAVSTANSALSTADGLADTKANKGANSDITSLSGLTTALSITQGGTGATTVAGARSNFGLGSAALKDTGVSGDAVPLLNANNTWSGIQTLDTPLAVSSGGTGVTSLAALFTALNIFGRVVGVTQLVASGTWTPSATAKSAFVFVQAGGGAGGGSTSPPSGSSSAGTGGNSGSGALIYIPTLVASYSYVVGSGGVSVTGASGGSGGDTSFGALCSVVGGAGGNTLTSSGTSSGGPTTQPSDYTEPTLFRTGTGFGTAAFVLSGAARQAGHGADSSLGRGGRSSATGEGGGGFGSGGGGGEGGSGNPARSGGDGSGGCILIIELS